VHICGVVCKWKQFVAFLFISPNLVVFMCKIITKVFAAICLLFVFGQNYVCAQAPAATAAEKPKTDHSYKPLQLKLNDDGSKYVRFIIWNQMWFRYTQNNPGTLDADGNELASTVDIGARRLRFLAYAQISPRFLILTHWGINNQTFATGGAPSSGPKKPQLFIHDAWNEFAVIPDKLHIGMGLHYWQGPSRMSSASTLNFMTLDAPIFNWQNIEIEDQFARQFGVYAKGQVGRLDYRIAANKPFTVNPALATLDSTKTSATEIAHHTWAATGYFAWQFMDKEAQKLPFTVGTHLGAKKVFNIGAGFYYHPKGTGQYDATAEGKHKTNDVLHFAADLYYERPLNKEKNTAFHLYSVFHSFNFGPNYLRNIGIMNLGGTADAATVSFNGVGNAQPTLGTGQIAYAQVGYLLPKMEKGQLMPYATFTYKNFERLNGATTQFDLGLNYFLNGHNAKITAQYGMRPIIDKTTLEQSGMKGEFILQTHIFL
jgi:hypothetical protein